MLAVRCISLGHAAARRTRRAPNMFESCTVLTHGSLQVAASKVEIDVYRTAENPLHCTCACPATGRRLWRRRRPTAPMNLQSSTATGALRSIGSRLYESSGACRDSSDGLQLAVCVDDRSEQLTLQLLGKFQSLSALGSRPFTVDHRRLPGDLFAAFLRRVPSDRGVFDLQRR